MSSLKFMLYTRDRTDSYISELLNLDTEITAPNSTLYYETLPELPPGQFLKVFLVELIITKQDGLIPPGHQNITT